MTAQEARIRELESQLAERDEMIGSLQNSIDELNRLVTNLTEIITQMRRDKFGPSSEKTGSTSYLWRVAAVSFGTCASTQRGSCLGSQ